METAAPGGGGANGNREATGHRHSTPLAPRPQAHLAQPTSLRPYQLAVLEQLRGEVAAGRRRVLLVAPTGSGKTVIASEIVRQTVERGRCVLMLAHRRELIHHAHAKLYDNGIDAGIILAGWPSRPGEPVQVASVQTLGARAIRSAVMTMPEAGLVIVDEAHHVRATTYRKILDAYPDATIVGLTATPCRGDGKGLGNVFDAIVECPSVGELIDMGFLVPTRVYAPTQPDLTGVAVARGDYVESQLAGRMDKPTLIGDIVEHWHRLADRRRTVVFATGVAHSVHIRDEFRRAGVLAEHLDGSTPADERDAILARLAAGDVEVVTNCMVLTEGWDCPSVACVVLARPTRHIGLFRQMIGRVLRPAPGKIDALVLDHAGAVFEHGLVEEPVNWTLDADRRADLPNQAARAAGRMPKLATCPECGAVRMEGRPCGSCGWRPRPKAAPIEVIDGDLAPVDRALRTAGHVWTGPEKVAFHRQLLWIARERGRKPGWAAYSFKDKFGSWPATRFATPEPPEAAVRAWVRSRDIAYAKSLEKRGAA